MSEAWNTSDARPRRWRRSCATGTSRAFPYHRRRSLQTSHLAHEFIAQLCARNLATLAGNLREAVEAGDVVPMIDIQILIEVRLLTVVMDGIGLQRLLDPSTDISVAVTACVNRALAAWQGCRVGGELALRSLASRSRTLRLSRRDMASETRPSTSSRGPGSVLSRRCLRDAGLVPPVHRRLQLPGSPSHHLGIRLLANLHRSHIGTQQLL